MRNKVSCPKCAFNKIYRIRREKLRCASCKYEWKQKQLPLQLNKREWADILKWFLYGISSKSIAEQTGINRKRIIRALFKVRQAMMNDIPDIFSGTIEIDETYIGGQWKNKKKSQKACESKRGRGTLKTPVFGILCRGSKVWAKVVADVEAKTLMPLISRRVKQGSVICSDTWRSYTGIAAKGYVHRLIEHGKGEYTDSQGNHINGLEGFWGYLKRRLASKGGIRKEKLSLYLAEYVWKYNHRYLSNKQQINEILKMLSNHNSIKISG